MNAKYILLSFICLIPLVAHAQIPSAEVFFQNYQDLWSPTNTPVYLSTCTWVVTQAFGGWENIQVYISQGSYLRWGQTRCVVQVTPPTTMGAGYNGGVIRDGFLKVFAAGGWDWTQGGSAYTSNGVNTNFGFAHSSYFGGDVGYSERTVDPEEDIFVEFGSLNNTANSTVLRWHPQLEYPENPHVRVHHPSPAPSGAEQPATNPPQPATTPQPANHTRDQKRDTAICNPASNDGILDQFITCQCQDSGIQVEVVCSAYAETEQSDAAYTWGYWGNIINDLFGAVGAAISQQTMTYGMAIPTSYHPGGLLLTPRSSTSFATATMDNNDNTCCYLALQQAQFRFGGNMPPPQCTCVNRQKDWLITINSGITNNIGA